MHAAAAGHRPSFDFRIVQFAIGINRVSVSQHGTALLIFTSIPKHKHKTNKSLIENEI
jgi:hypothetical protein